MLGVNIERMPPSFYMCLPSVARDLNHKAYGGPATRATETTEGGFITGPYDPKMPLNFSKVLTCVPHLLHKTLHSLTPHPTVS